MILKSICTALALIACCVAAPSAYGQSPAQTVIADPPNFQLGFIEPRSTITRSFRLVNTMDKPITIKSATPTCTCTTVEAQGKVIPPSSSIELPMTMKVSASTGVKTAAVTFDFGTGIAPVTVSMSGEIAYQVRGVAIDGANGATVPYINAFNDPAAPQGAPQIPLSGTVTIGSIDRSPFRIESVFGAPPTFVDYDPSVDAPRAAYKIRYDFSSIPCQQMPPYLVVATDHPKAPVIDMRIRHACTRISPLIPFAEYRANLGAVAAGSTVPFEFELKHAKGWRISQTLSKDPRIAVDLVGQRSDPESSMISLVAKIDPTITGTVLAPVTMTGIDPTGATKSSDFWIYFKVVGSAAVPPQAPQIQNAGS